MGPYETCKPPKKKRIKMLKTGGILCNKCLTKKSINSWFCSQEMLLKYYGTSPKGCYFKKTDLLKGV
jgi:hypothetical protein